jgi:hypothetical protein
MREKPTNATIFIQFIYPFMPEVAIFEFVHDIYICYLEKFKKQEFEEKMF